METKSGTMTRDSPTQEGTDARSPAKFPLRLFQLLDDAKNERFEHIVSWLPSGKAFKVHNSHAFEEHIISRYFRQTRYKSFQRQLNLYGFQRIQSGEDTGAYFHCLFIRNNFHLLCLINRSKVIKDNPTPGKLSGDQCNKKTTSSSSPCRQQYDPLSRSLSSTTNHEDKVTIDPTTDFNGMTGTEAPMFSFHDDEDDDDDDVDENVQGRIRDESQSTTTAILSNEIYWKFKIEPTPLPTSVFNEEIITITDPDHIQLSCTPEIASAIRWLFDSPN